MGVVIAFSITNFTQTLSLLFGLLALLSTLWAIVLGGWVARKAW